MPPVILNQVGNTVDPARVLFPIESNRLDTGTRLQVTYRSANLRRLEYPPVTIEEIVPYPIFIWDWWQYINAKYDYICDYANIKLSKVEQIDDVDYRFDAYARRQAEFVVVSSAEWEPIYTEEQPDRERITYDIWRMLKLRSIDDRLVCPPIDPIVDVRITKDDDVRVLANGDIRIARVSVSAEILGG